MNIARRASLPAGLALPPGLGVSALFSRISWSHAPTFTNRSSRAFDFSRVSLCAFAATRHARNASLESCNVRSFARSSSLASNAASAGPAMASQYVHARRQMCTFRWLNAASIAASAASIARVHRAKKRDRAFALANFTAAACRRHRRNARS